MASERSPTTEPCPKLLQAEVDCLIGKPWERMGQGPVGFYCLGLALYLLRKVAGVELEDPFLTQISEERLRTFQGRFLHLPVAVGTQPLDLLFSRSGRDAHVSVVEDDRWAVSVNEIEGVVRVPLSQELRLSTSIYRLKELL